MASEVTTSREPESWHVTVYENGNLNFRGKTLLVNKKKTKDLDSFCDDVTSVIKPREGCVRRLATPNHGTRIHDLDDLQPGGEYVAMCGPKFKKLPYKEGPPKRPGPISPREIKPVEHAPQYRYKSAQFRKQAAQNTGINFRVFPNGDDLSAGHPINLKPFQMKYGWSRILDNISEVMQKACYGLVTLDGETVTDISSIHAGALYVALGPHERFQPKQYGFSPQGSRNASRKREPLPPIRPGAGRDATQNGPPERHRSDRFRLPEIAEDRRRVGHVVPSEHWERETYHDACGHPVRERFLPLTPDGRPRVTFIQSDMELRDRCKAHEERRRPARHRTQSEPCLTRSFLYHRPPPDSAEASTVRAAAIICFEKWWAQVAKRSSSSESQSGRSFRPESAKIAEDFRPGSAAIPEDSREPHRGNINKLEVLSPIEGPRKTAIEELLEDLCHPEKRKKTVVKGTRPTSGRGKRARKRSGSVSGQETPNPNVGRREEEQENEQAQRKPNRTEKRRIKEQVMFDLTGESKPRLRTRTNRKPLVQSKVKEAWEPGGKYGPAAGKRTTGQMSDKNKGPATKFVPNTAKYKKPPTKVKPFSFSKRQDNQLSSNRWTAEVKPVTFNRRVTKPAPFNLSHQTKPVAPVPPEDSNTPRVRGFKVQTHEMKKRTVPATTLLGVTKRTVPATTPLGVTKRTVPATTLLGVTKRTAPATTPLGVTKRTVPATTPLGVKKRTTVPKPFSFDHPGGGKTVSTDSEKKGMEEKKSDSLKINQEEVSKAKKRSSGAISRTKRRTPPEGELARVNRPKTTQPRPFSFDNRRRTTGDGRRRPKTSSGGETRKKAGTGSGESGTGSDVGRETPIKKFLRKLFGTTPAPRAPDNSLMTTPASSLQGEVEYSGEGEASSRGGAARSPREGEASRVGVSAFSPALSPRSPGQDDVSARPGTPFPTPSLWGQIRNGTPPMETSKFQNGAPAETPHRELAQDGASSKSTPKDPALDGARTETPPRSSAQDETSSRETPPTKTGTPPGPEPGGTLPPRSFAQDEASPRRTPPTILAQDGVSSPRDTVPPTGSSEPGESPVEGAERPASTRARTPFSLWAWLRGRSTPSRPHVNTSPQHVTSDTSPVSTLRKKLPVKRLQEGYTSNTHSVPLTAHETYALYRPRTPRSQKALRASHTQGAHPLGLPPKLYLTVLYCISSVFSD